MTNGTNDMNGSGGDGDRLDELLALAALGELTAADEAELDAALDMLGEQRDAVVSELDDDVAVAAALQSMHAEPPPADMKAAVMAAIDALDEPARPGEELAAPAAESSDDVVDLATARSARSRRLRGWQPFAAAAAVVMLLVGGVLVATRGGDDGSRFDAIAQADDGQQRVLDGELDGTLEVVYSPSEDAFVLVGTGVPTLTDAETYQLWFVDDDGAQPIGLFRPDDDGRVEQVYADLDPSRFVVGVTVEPAGGSDTPTLPIVAAA